ncbi:alcohol dehydrogenase, partial [Rhizobium ruizarguesonis]
MLDRRQGDRPRRLAVDHRLPKSDAPEILPSEESHSMSSNITANWSYPTSVKLGRGRIAEL